MNLKEAKKIHQRILSDIVLKKIKKWKEVAVALSLPIDFFGTDSDRPVIWKLVKKVLHERELTLERETATRQGTEIVNWSDYRRINFLYDRLDEQFASARIAQEKETIPIFDPEEPEGIVLPETIRIKCQLFKFQDKATRQLWKKLFIENKPSAILQAGVGLGKTFINGRLIRAIIDSGYLEGKTVSPWPIMYVTKASVVEQTKRVLKYFFGIDLVTKCCVTNYDQLRATFGSQFLKIETVVKHGEAHIVYRFLQNVHPCVMIWDECHSLKNEDSQQHKIGAAFNQLDSYFAKWTKQIFTSATLCTSVAEAKCMVVSTRMEFIKGVVITNEYWPTMARQISAPANPYQKSEAAMDRLMDKLDPYVVHVKGVKPQFRAHNRVCLMQFQNTWERNFYNAAWERYCEALAKIDKDEPGGSFALLAQFTMFRKAAEYVRTEYMAKDAYMLEREGLAPVMVCNYKQTITKIVKHLILDYGIPRSKISIIWGGETQVRAYTRQQAEDLLAKIRYQGGFIPTASQLKKLEEYLRHREDSDAELAKYEEEAAFIEKYELGPQSKKQRQYEIDKFQQGKALYCLYTYKAGGVGLSLHHSDEWTDFKCRRKPSGYVYEEDIPFVDVRQRAVRGQPTYSPIEAVQGFGRVPRLTSLSDTDQAFLYYAGTIEEAVADRCSQGLKCLKKTIRTNSREHWEDIIVRGAIRGSEHVQHATTLALAEIGVAKKRFDEQEVDDNIFEIDISEEDEEDA